MKRFDKGYIYSHMLSDLLYLLGIIGGFIVTAFSEEDADLEKFLFILPFPAIGLGVIYLGLIAYRIMYYKTSGYELTETEFKCHTGVFFKKRSIVEYNKIHAINKKQGIFNRIFGIAVLTVDSGSANTSHQAEITVVEKSATVDLLLNKLNALKENSARISDSEVASREIILSDDNSLFRFTSKGKLLYSLINIVSTAFFIVIIWLLSTIVISSASGLLQQDILGGTWGQYFMFSALFSLVAILVFSLFVFITCILYSFVAYYRFSITKQGDSIQISFGLLEKHTNTFSYDRIKAVKISQGIVQRMLGFASIHLEVIGYTLEAGNNNTNIGVLVPFCKYKEVDQILERVLPDHIPDKKQTKSAAFFPFISWFLLFWGIATGAVISLTAVIMGIFNATNLARSATVISISAIAIIVLLIKMSGAVLGYKNNGIAINGRKISVYSGGFTRTVTVFMANNLVAVENVTTPLRQKHGIASQVMHLKTNASSNEVKVHIQKEELTDKLKSLLIL